MNTDDKITPKEADFIAYIMRGWLNEFGEPTNPPFHKKFHAILEKMERRAKDK